MVYSLGTHPFAKESTMHPIVFQFERRTFCYDTEFKRYQVYQDHDWIKVKDPALVTRLLKFMNDGSGPEMD
jgi:hypothetical protein